MNEKQNYRVRQGGLMRCCLTSLDNYMLCCIAPPKEGDKIQCASCKIGRIIFKAGAWEWTPGDPLQPKGKRMQVTLTFPLFDQTITAEIEVTVTSSGRSESPQSLTSAGRPAEDMEFEVDSITISEIDKRTANIWIARQDFLWSAIESSEDLYTKVFDAYEG